MTRRYDPRRAKPHLSYSREDLCKTFEVGLSTISAWTGKGLRPIDQSRPYLYAGAAVRHFLEQHNKPRQPTGPGEVYCVACKRVAEPAGGTVHFIQLNATNGDFIGTCPGCSHLIYQRVRISDIVSKAGDLTVRYEDGAATLVGNGAPSRTEPLSET